MTRFLPALLALIFAGAAHAQQDAFTVDGVLIDATAGSATAAREQAIAEGAPRALRILMERLTLEEHHGRLPSVGASTATSLAYGFEVNNELRGINRYRGELSVSFDPEGVRDLLRRYGTPFVESAAPPTLVIPVYVVDGRPTLWNANPWAEGWDESRYIGGFAPVVLSSGFGARVSMISTESVASGDLDTMAALANQYGVDRVLLAVAEPQGDTLEVDMTLIRMTEEIDVNAPVPDSILGRLAPILRGSGEDGMDDDPFGGERFDSDPFGEEPRPAGPGTFAEGGMFADEDEEDDPTGGLQPEAEDLGMITVRAGESQAPFRLAADRVHAQLAEAWKRQTVIRSARRTELELTVLYEGIGDWHSLRDALGASPFVTDARLDGLSGDGALMTVTYRGERGQLITDLQRRGVELRVDPDLGDVVFSASRLSPFGSLQAPASAPRGGL